MRMALVGTLMGSFAGLTETSQPAGTPLKLLFIKQAEQCFSLTTNQPEQCFSAKFQTSERGQYFWMPQTVLLSVMLLGQTSP